VIVPKVAPNISNQAPPPPPAPKLPGYEVSWNGSDRLISQRDEKSGPGGRAVITTADKSSPQLAKT